MLVVHIGFDYFPLFEIPIHPKIGKTLKSITSCRIKESRLLHPYISAKDDRTYGVGYLRKIGRIPSDRLHG